MKRRGGSALVQPPLPTMPDNWFTPDDLYQEFVERYGPFTLDVAATERNAKCEEYYTEEVNGLTMPWSGRVWCNPPYQKLIQWVKKAFDETQAGNCEIAVLLLPAHTSTEWFHDYVLPHAELYWVRGKRKFGGRSSSALMPSVGVIFRRPSLFAGEVAS